MSEPYKFNSFGKEGALHLTSFSPRSKAALDYFIKKNSNKKIFYLQKQNEGFLVGEKYSYILYANQVQFYLRTSDLEAKFHFEEGIEENQTPALKDLLIKNNENNIMFAPEMLKSFENNTKLVIEKGHSCQAYHNSKIVGHVSLIRMADPIFGNAEITVLLRLVVDKEYRNTGIKERLMGFVSQKVDINTPMYLQVFPNNYAALRFFLRRTNAVIFWERWRV